MPLHSAAHLRFVKRFNKTTRWYTQPEAVSAARVALSLSMSCGRLAVVQRALALVEYSVAQPCFLPPGGDRRAACWAPHAQQMENPMGWSIGAGIGLLLATRIVMPSNPYEPPHQESSDVNSRRRVSRRMIFWGGIATIFLALAMFNGSHSLYVHSKAAGGHYDRIVFVLDICAIIAVIAGCVALVVCHLVPCRRRRFPWRRP